MSLRDLCTFATEHMRGEQGNGTLFKPVMYELLHEPVLNNVACGWAIKRSGDKPILFWHNGSNTHWYAFVAFSPSENTVVAVASNDGDYKNAEAAALGILERVIPSQQ